MNHYNYNHTHNCIYLFALFIFVTFYTYIEYQLTNTNRLRYLSLLVINLIVEDFYSGILHIVLDEPENQNMIIIGSYAKLFQEHLHSTVHSTVEEEPFPFGKWSSCISILYLQKI